MQSKHNFFKYSYILNTVLFVYRSMNSELFKNVFFYKNANKLLVYKSFVKLLILFQMKIQRAFFFNFLGNYYN